MQVKNIRNLPAILLVITAISIPTNAKADSGLVNPAEFGFAPDAPPATNAAALQKALDGGKRTVRVTQPGVYGLDRTVWLDSDTRLVFGPGVVLQKQKKFVHVLANRGLQSRKWDANITVEGVRIDVNEFSLTHDENSPMFGHRGQISFSHIRNLTVRDFTCLNLHGNQYAFQIATFENVILDGFEIRGAKDGVHINAGRKFVVRNGTVETGDDGIALNAEDWTSSAPVIGDIEDGLIENVTDDGQGRAHFARILTGAWVDWHEGIRVQRGDTVRCGKNLYRVLMPLGTKEYVSMEKPSHASGIWTDKSGLRFWFMQDNGISSANIRNVTFRNIYLRSPRPGLRGDWETRSEWNRAIHPEVKREDYPVCEIRLEDVYSESPYPLVFGNQSVTVWLRNVVKTRGPLLDFWRDGCDINVSAHLSGVLLKPDDGKGADIGVRGAGASLNLTVDGLIQARDLRLAVDAGAAARVNGIGSINTLENLTPKKGDSVKVKGVLKTFDGEEWR